jgi:epoxyqueuosine reductase
MKATHAGLAAEIVHEAQKIGFNRLGITPPEPARRLDAYMRWIAAGMHGEMSYLARPDRVARRQDLNRVLPGVRSVIVVGLDYFAGSPPPAIVTDPSRGRISNYAWNVDYHEVMVPRLDALAGWLRDRSGGTEVASRVYVDTGAILERDHGETAGLGFTGKNTMLIDPRRGSWFFLGILLTTLPIEYDSIASSTDPKNPTCGRCRRCLDACPTNAFPEPHMLDARRCISYLTIELKGWIPADLRPLMGNWVYGCDVCQEVCPFNRFARPIDEPAFQPVTWNDCAPPLIDLLAMDEEHFRRRFDNSPIGRIKRNRMVRNACVAAGNWGSPEMLPALIRLLSDAESIIRGHAAWALHRIGGEEAQRALALALDREVDELVRRELAGGG